MRVAYFDCFSGICGDMILGALIDLGLDGFFFKKEINKLDLSGYEINIQKVEKNHICATNVDIVVKEKQPHRTLMDINKIIETSDLDTDIKQESKQIFLHLAQAESKVHHTTIDKIHFHEIGAIDSIIDIVGAVIGINKLKITKIYCSPLPLGKGFVKCSHGIIPIPAPATVELLKNIPIYQTKRMQELVTPTGAAVITTIAKQFGQMPPLKIHKIGYGSGKTQSEYPNILRIFIGDLEKMKKKIKKV
jgi:uncharacterized protein (TIGR00299 family) protein